SAHGGLLDPGRRPFLGLLHAHRGARRALSCGGTGVRESPVAVGEDGVRVSLLVTCLGDALFPEVGVATVRLLRRLGVEVDFPQAQTCCGQPHFNSGYRAGARELARHTIKAFANGQLVVTPSGSCAAMVKLEYPELF